MGWIKVSELMPEEDEKVLVWLVDGLGPQWAICHYQWPEPATGFEGAWVLDYDPNLLYAPGSAELLNSPLVSITHWEPMPEPPVDADTEKLVDRIMALPKERRVALRIMVEELMGEEESDHGSSQESR